MKNELQEKVNNGTATKQDKIELYKLYSVERELETPTPTFNKPCEHKTLRAEFMGGGFLHSCTDCGETIYGIC
jgi:hypothetical protein